MLMEEGMLLFVATPPIRYKLSELMVRSVVLYLHFRTVSCVHTQQGVSVARPPAYPKNSCTQNQKKNFFGSFHVILRPPKKKFFFSPTQTGGRASASNIDGIRLCLNLGYMPKK